ncbi:PH domain-containing protein [Flavobacterium urocaniciphilum]|uniref:PH domain-containing protein n=1 Tax=Flavobacterium urocaniciphilum TaxID=1299341 RepID=A0A1H8YS58_9FLAO|nr:PH domain-containing protein [Flavobacterium urocaniciphilum]SEP55055.1 PH domain-containing protein [Flavobacterium urocaniciphilum]
MKYKSDFSKFNFIILLIPVILVLIIGIFEEKDIEVILIPPAVILGLLVFIFTVLYFTTYYEIQKEELIISMFFYKVRIKISEIRNVNYSNSFIKTNIYKPGFHHKGIEILYHKYDDIFISPQNREQFIAQLKEHNPTIEIKK